MSFSYYRSLTVDHTKCGASDSTNFPVAFVGTYAWCATVANGGRAQNANGYDIRPYADTGAVTLRDYELVTYNATTGAIELHWREPTLSHSVDPVDYMFIGDAGISTNGSTTAAWNSGFAFVQHFKDGTTLSLNDSTANANNGTNNNSVAAVAGQLDGGAGFVKASSRNVSMASSASLNFTPTSFTFSCLVKRSATGTWQGLYSSGGLATNNWAIAFSGGGGVDRIDCVKYNVADNFSTGTISNTTNWHKVDVVKNTDSGVNLAFYIDGAASGTATIGALTTPATTKYIAWDSGAGEYFDGSMDEVRLSNVARSADWLTAEYNNQLSPSTFYTVGSEVPVSSGYTLAAAQGSYTLTGQIALLDVGHRLVSAQGSYVLTGEPANLDVGRKLIAAQGAYALAGQAAGLIAARRLSMTQGAYVLTGEAAALVVGRRLIAVSGSYGLTGEAASLLYSGAGKILTAAQGAYVLNGQAANLLKRARVISNVGVFVLAGQPATLHAARLLQLTTGYYVLVGEDAALTPGVLVFLGPPPHYVVARGTNTTVRARSGNTTVRSRET